MRTAISGAQQARVEAIVANVVAALLARRSGGLDGARHPTMALAKLKTLYFGIGYPNSGGLCRPTVDLADPVGNLGG